MQSNCRPYFLPEESWSTRSLAKKKKSSRNSFHVKTISKVVFDRGNLEEAAGVVLGGSEPAHRFLHLLSVHGDEFRGLGE